jgi:hypothetical protein
LRRVESVRAGFRPGFVGRGLPVPEKQIPAPDAIVSRCRDLTLSSVKGYESSVLRVKRKFRLKTKVMQLRVKCAYDPLLFRSHVESFLAEREAENNLVFGILASVTDGVQKFSHDRPLLVSVEGRHRNSTGRSSDSTVQSGVVDGQDR